MLVHLLAQADKLNVLLTRIHSNMDGSGRGKNVCSLFRSTTFSRSTTWGEQVLKYSSTRVLKYNCTGGLGKAEIEVL